MSWGDARPQVATAASRWITNPKHMPIIRVTDSNLSVKDQVNTSKASNNAGFYTAMALLGSSGAITVADTFVTLLSASGGGGFLYHVVAPTHSANHTPTIEITVDGVVYTIAPTAVFAAQSRLVLGATTPGAPVITTLGTYNETQVIQVSGYNDVGFQGRIGGIHTLATGPVTLPSEQMVMSYNMPILRWEQSILIRVKASLLSGVAVDKQCGAHYRLDT